MYGQLMVAAHVGGDGTQLAQRISAHFLRALDKKQNSVRDLDFNYHGVSLSDWSAMKAACGVTGANGLNYSDYFFLLGEVCDIDPDKPYRKFQCLTSARGDDRRVITELWRSLADQAYPKAPQLVFLSRACVRVLEGRVRLSGVELAAVRHPGLGRGQSPASAYAEPDDCLHPTPVCSQLENPYPYLNPTLPYPSSF